MYDSGKPEDRSASEPPLCKQRGHLHTLRRLPPLSAPLQCRLALLCSQAAPPAEHLPESGLLRLPVLKALPFISSYKSFSARLPNTLISGISITMLCLKYLPYDSSLVDTMKYMPCLLHWFCLERWSLQC